MTRRALGRGLGALLATEAAAGGAAMVDIDAIEPNPFQPRQAVEEEGIQELTSSIRAHGLIQPLVVTPTSEGRYQLIAGERRWRAARAAALTQVPVLVRDAAPREMLALAIIENVQRSDLDPLEAAAAYQRLMDEFGLTQLEVAETVGKSRAAVANTMRLLGLEDAVAELIRSGALTEGHGRALLAVESPALRQGLARQAARQGWSVRQLESEVRQANQAKSAEPRPAPSDAKHGDELGADVGEAVRQLEGALGTRVEIRRRGEAGQLVVYFYSEEELDALYRRLVEAAE
jgi:ParB family chromosome partitioning protein